MPEVLEQEDGMCEHFKKGTVAAVFRWFGRKAWIGQGTRDQCRNPDEVIGVGVQTKGEVRNAF